MSHYPNPFHFVPFPRAPILRTEQEFEALGQKFSGYLELEIKALTPIHIVGKVEGGRDEHRSFMYQQDGQPCIPASSIRGCLRAFVEAVTAGWVTEATPEYPKAYKKRHIGFKPYESYTPEKSSGGRTSPPAVDPAFRPGFAAGKLDVASYLFGFVAENKQAEHENQAYKSKVWVEDAYLDSAAMNTADYWAPDLAGDPFMGGAKPSASTWWYFKPAEVWQRNRPGGDAVAEFVGERFRGRKFYFHQDPLTCVQAYHPERGNWVYAKHPFHPVRLHCMDKDRQTLPFRIYLDGIPRPLFLLLMNVLRPGQHIRHKLGYAKAYGYGSIEFILKTANLRTATPGIPKALHSQTIPQGNWSEAVVERCGLTNLVDRNALTWLARILRWPHEGLLFMYPQYRKQEFQQTVMYHQYTQALQKLGMPANTTLIRNRQEAHQLANGLLNIKRTIDFDLYQEESEDWAKIMNRQP